MTTLLAELRQTCSACPSQWEGRTEDGLDLYVRYRWGWLTWGFGEGMDNAIDACLAQSGVQLGDALDGELSTFKMLRALGLKVAS
jgi:hypothetical protein